MPTFSDAASYLDTLPLAAAMAQTHPPHQGAPFAVSPTLPVIPPPTVQPSPTPSIPGFSAVPAKLVRKIWVLEYIDMWELLPETWCLDTTSISCCHDWRPRHGLVTVIDQYLEAELTAGRILGPFSPGRSTAWPWPHPQKVAFDNRPLVSGRGQRQ